MPIILNPSTRKDKRFMAEINGKTIHFGSKNGNTYLEHKDKVKRENYLKRHIVNEDWTKINPASLSRFILWGDSTNINDNIEDYKKRFKI
jgi:hypothetical protein